MDIQTRILALVSKRVAKEASRKELAELNTLLRQNPEIKASLKKLIDHWDAIHFDNPLSEKEMDENLAGVLAKIHQQINMPASRPDCSPDGQ